MTRPRGRGRKGQNFSNRSLESNGPDVKVRGTAAHICERYQALARDAQVVGDRVSAENYLQHAEHYYRFLMAARAQFQDQQINDNGHAASQHEAAGDEDSRAGPGSAGRNGMDGGDGFYDVAHGGASADGGSRPARNTRPMDDGQPPPRSSARLRNGPRKRRPNPGNTATS